MKWIHNIKIAIIVLIISISLFLLTVFEVQLSKVNNSSAEKEVIIERGSIDKIGKTLKEKI